MDSVMVGCRDLLMDSVMVGSGELLLRILLRRESAVPVSGMRSALSCRAFGHEKTGGKARYHPIQTLPTPLTALSLLWVIESCCWLLMVLGCCWL